MFDWNDEELRNIIWGEGAEEGGDHIVPHPDTNQEKDSDVLRKHVKNAWNKECVDLKPKELTQSIIISHGIKSESSSSDGTLGEKAAHDSDPKTEGETAASEIIQSPLEESDNGEFVDYGWANVGSFEDLDRIFSNEDPILGNASLGTGQDLWTCCRDETGIPEKSFFLKDDSQSLGISPLRNKEEQSNVEDEVPEPSSRLKYMSSQVNGFASLPYLSPFHSMGVSHRVHEVPCRPLSMTPQEKIEKLRRKQQMKAMLAIQKQQRQFDSEESSMKYSALERESNETKQSLPTFDLNSPMQQDFSNMVFDEGSAADTILYQFQDTISKLDMNIRLTMRDSLYRLANGASQRRYECGTSSNHFVSRSDAKTKQESNVQLRFPETCNVETETNPIDRTMARLLFYRPMDIPGKHDETK